MAALTLWAATFVAQAYSGYLDDPAPARAVTPPAAGPAFPARDVRPLLGPAPPPPAEAKVAAPRAAEPAPRPAPAPAASPYDRMNAERRRCGAPPLVRDDRLDAIAAGRLKDLASNGYGHALPDGSDPLPALRARHGFTGHVAEGLVIGGVTPAGLEDPAEAGAEPEFAPPPKTPHADLVNPAWTRVGFASGRSGLFLCSVTIYGREAPPQPAPESPRDGRPAAAAPKPRPAAPKPRPATLISDPKGAAAEPVRASAQEPDVPPEPDRVSAPAPTYYYYTVPQVPQYQPLYTPIQPQGFGFGYGYGFGGGGGCANGMCGGGFR